MYSERVKGMLHRPASAPAAITAQPASDGGERVPDAVVARAKAAFRRRTEGELAVLALDSLIDLNAPPTDHRLRFDHPRLQVDVHVASADGRADLSGQVGPPAPVQFRLEFAGDIVARIDDSTDGSFSFRQVPGGVIRLHLTGPSDTTPVYTDWFRVC